MSLWKSCAIALISAVIVCGTLVSQTKIMVKVNVENWGNPDSGQVWRVYEHKFDDFVEGQDSINQLYLKQSFYWRPDTTWQLMQFVFDSVIGRGDQRKALVTVVGRWTILPDNVFPGGMYTTAPSYVTLPGTPVDTPQYSGYRRYAVRSDSLTGLGSWLGYTTRIFPLYPWLNLFSRGNWRTLDFMSWTDSTVVTLEFSLVKVVGLNEQSRAILQFHASRKPMYERRWWQK